MSHHAIRIPISVIPAQAGTYPRMGLSADVRPGRVPASAGMTAVGMTGRGHLGGLAMMKKNDRITIVFAGAGPLVRLAAAGLLDTLRGLNLIVVLVDRIEDEVVGDKSKPFANEIAVWIDDMGPAILRATTAIGAGVTALRAKTRSAEEDAVLKSALRDSGQLALREFLGRWQPAEASSAVVVYEDRRVPPLFLAAEFPLTLMTTRTFVRVIQNWGLNVRAVEALESIADRYDLKQAMIAEIDPEMPEDQRHLPKLYKP